MKSSVDLTQNRAFETHSSELQIRISQLQKLNFFERFKSDKRDLRSRDSVFLLGNKKQRATIKMYNKLMSGNYCDRCGDKIMPWENKKGLCRRCEDSYLPRERCPWRKAT
jgi:hypothetical protein